jgi:hypothetical protein
LRALLLALLTAVAPSPATPAKVQARTTLRVPAPARDVVAVGWAGPRRLVVLRPESIALVRLDPARAVVESEAPLPGPRVAVRTPGGLIVGPSEGPVWVMTSRAPRAALFDLERGRLRLRSEADALPWPGATSGLRFLAGTNLIEGALAGRSGPFVAADPASGAVVAADGTLVAAGIAEPGARAGSAVAGLWPGWVVASSARPPPEDDCLRVLSPDGALLEVKIAGAVSALASRLEREKAVVAVATASSAEADLLVLELTRTPSP